ncbi:MAG: hypothetical protein ACFFC7_25130, partial [Candidatus Hermodarchaeota archaeon]
MEEENLRDLSKERRHLQTLLENIEVAEETYQKEATKWRLERERIKASRKPLMDKAAKLREERDLLNREVSLLKDSRTQSQEQFQKDLASLRTIHGSSDDPYSGMNLAELRYRIYELEYQIQTAGLPFEEEEKLVKEIALIDEIIQERKERGEEETEKKDEETLKKNLDLWKKKADVAHALLEKKVELAQAKHRELSKLYDNINKIFEKEQAAHEKFVEALKQVEGYRERKEEIRMELREFGDRIWQARQFEKEKDKREQEKEIQSKVQELLDKKSKG